MGNWLAVIKNKFLSTKVEVAPPALLEHTKALVLVAEQLAPIADFFRGQNLASVMQSKAKSDVTSAAISSAIQTLGFDASRYDTYATEIPHLVDKIFSKIEEREAAKANGEKRGPDIDSTKEYKDWIEKLIRKNHGA